MKLLKRKTIYRKFHPMLDCFHETYDNQLWATFAPKSAALETFLRALKFISEICWEPNFWAERVQEHVQSYTSRDYSSNVHQNVQVGAVRIKLKV